MGPVPCPDADRLEGGAPLGESREQEDERDHALILAFQGGDVGAFDKLYMAYLKPLYFFVKRWIYADPHEIEDQCQEIMISVYQALPRFVPHSSFRAFLYTVARNQLRNYRRKKTAHSLDENPAGEFHGDTLKDLLPSAYAENTDALFQRSLSRQVELAIAALPDSAREVFLLKEFQGLTFQEIAEATRQTSRNAQFLKSKANQTIRDHLAKAGFTLAELSV